MSFTKCVMATKQRGRESAFSVRWDLDVERLNYVGKVCEKVLTFCGVCGIIIVSRGEVRVREEPAFEHKRTEPPTDIVSAQLSPLGTQHKKEGILL